MTEKNEKKDAFGSWMISVALWLAMICFAANQGMQVIASQRVEHYTLGATDDVTCAVAVNGTRQTMRCFREENEE